MVAFDEREYHRPLIYRTIDKSGECGATLGHTNRLSFTDLSRSEWLFLLFDFTEIEQTVTKQFSAICVSEREREREERKSN